MKRSLNFLLITSFFLTVSCREEPAVFDAKHLINDWVCISLMQGEEEQPFVEGSIRFTFRSDSTYDYQGGLYIEKGKWKLKKDLLITKAEDNLEKQVRILSLTSDTLSILMNDRGFEMKMILVSE